MFYIPRKTEINDASQKEWLIVLTLSLFGGIFGLHHFYVKNYQRALFRLGLFLIIAIGIFILSSSFSIFNSSIFSDFSFLSPFSFFSPDKMSISKFFIILFLVIIIPFLLLSVIIIWLLDIIQIILGNFQNNKGELL